MDISDNTADPNGASAENVSPQHTCRRSVLKELLGGLIAGIVAAGALVVLHAADTLVIRFPFASTRAVASDGSGKDRRVLDSRSHSSNRTEASYS